MTNEEKMEKLSIIGKHVKLIDERYGFSNCPAHLKAALEEVRAALKNRVHEIIEA